MPVTLTVPAFAWAAQIIAAAAGGEARPEATPPSPPPCPPLVSFEIEKDGILRGGLPLPECMTLIVARIARPAGECGRGAHDARLAGYEVAFHWTDDPPGPASDRPLLFTPFAETDEHGEAFAYVISGLREGEFRLAASCGSSRLEKTLRQVAIPGPGIMVGRAPELPAEPAGMDDAARERIRREITRLKGRDAEDALKNLAGFGRAALTELVRAAFDQTSPPKVRELCGRAIGRIRDEEALRALVGMLTDRRPGIQQVAEWGLRSRGMDAAAPFLQLSLESRLAHVRGGALRAAAEFRDARWMEAAAAGLGDPNPYVRACAAWCRVRSATADAELPEAPPPGSAISEATRRGGASRHGLTAAISDPVPAVRRAAVASICRRIGEEIALARLEYRPAKDADGYCVESLISALNDLRPPNSLFECLRGLALLTARIGDDDMRGTLRAGLEAAVVSDPANRGPAPPDPGAAGSK
ncbi:MAG: hypothetical protein N3A38_12530 [Planctomycetota bacterium]|nr:hypothetical protein [Planctomycetota bacterium]